MTIPVSLGDRAQHEDVSTDCLDRLAMWWLGRSEDDGVWLSLCDGVCQLRGAHPNIRQVHDLHVLAKAAPQLGSATLDEEGELALQEWG